MLESPPASAAALPSFLVEDSDFLPSWSKSLSTSPRLGPNNATSSTHSAGASTNAAGLDVFGPTLAFLGAQRRTRSWQMRPRRRALST